MIRVICRCGGVARVEQTAAGRRIPCPKCGSPIIVPGLSRPADGGGPGAESVEPAPAKRPPVDERPEPAPAEPAPAEPAPPEPAPAKPAPARPARRDRPDAALSALAAVAGGKDQAPAPPIFTPDTSGKGGAFLLGAAMLATALIPWGVKDGSLVMSWRVLQQAQAQAMLVLIGVWVTGVAAIVAGIVLGRGTLAGSCLALSVIGLSIVLFSGEGMRQLAPWLAVARPIFRKSLFVLAGLMLMVQMAALRFRLRPDEGMPARVVQGMFGLAVAIVAVVVVILLIADYAGLAPAPRRRLFYDFVLFLGVWVCLLAGGLLAAMHAFAAAGARACGRAALRLNRLAVLAAVGYVIGRAVLTGGRAAAMPAVNVCLLVLAPWWLGRFAIGCAAAWLTRRFAAARQ